jgi:hypothetical protein
MQGDKKWNSNKNNNKRHKNSKNMKKDQLSRKETMTYRLPKKMMIDIHK